MHRLYFDYNASAPLMPGLETKVTEWLKSDYKNPSSTHQDGQQARSFIDRSRQKILKLLHAPTGCHLLFTSGGTEANHLVLASAFRRRKSKTKLLLTRVEHASVFNHARLLEKQGVTLAWVKVEKDGSVDLEDYARQLTQDVFLVSVMFANNETGFVFPIRKMAALAKEHGIPFHTDAVCATGKWPVHLEQLGVDFYTFSSHKFGGLKGVGGVVCADYGLIDPVLVGGSQEYAKRPGTENLLGIATTAYALEHSLEGLESTLSRQSAMRDALKAGMKKIYPPVVFIESKTTLPQTLSAALVGLNGNLLLANLDLEGVSASYGSACASGSLEVSRVLTEMTYGPEVAGSALRFSFGRETTPEDCEELTRRLHTVLERMR